FNPDLVLLPCVGYGPEGVRLGYGGGFYDRTVAALKPRPFTVGLCYSNGFLPMLRARADDLPLDALLTDDGVVWQR
ncbi:MAG: 5-formyltetrahydrofolate cyclo-ligase, partial [Pseudomonadota bacterium]|nr:5-formyltetrahydrofolate cyclo-ligase [Pseudomonadota bacterium]